MNVDMAEIGICSSCNIIYAAPKKDVFKLNTVPDIAVEVLVAEGEKCNRCWKVLPEVVGNELCMRCKKIINS